ncbi:MAG TPA: 2Fe-2S iron-sulfur cluster-binding protein [Bryobacteraceae bacterium]|nr:2Fe-2S iron-sulfur cluster-binding protein [Bryobacteraceae bacterium]
MPRITFLPARITIEFAPGTIPYQGHGKRESLLDVALHFGIALDHACGGNCACTTCHVVVKSGEEFLSPMDEDEEDRLFSAADLTLHSRLGCQAVVRGDVVVDIPAWNRNYVSEGGNQVANGQS